LESNPREELWIVYSFDFYIVIMLIRSINPVLRKPLASFQVPSGSLESL
jgi:hypothetical protein